MAVTVTDNRTVKDQADATTGWTAAGGTTSLSLGTADPFPVEASGHIATTTSVDTQHLWHTGSSLGTGPHLIYVWLLTTAVLDTRANGGIGVLIGDGTNRVVYFVGGSDVALFRADKGETGTRVMYMCLTIDTAQLATWPYGTAVQAGSRASLEANLNAITQVGVRVKSLAKAVGGAVNIWVDIIRTGKADDAALAGITVGAGTSDNPGKFSQIAVVDRDSGDLKAHGVIRELGSGVFGLQGSIRFGEPTTGASWFEDKNVVVVFEARDYTTTRYKISIVDNGTSTSTFRLGTKVGAGATATGQDGCRLIAPTGVGAQFDAASDADVTDVFIYGSAFVGFTEGVKLRSGHEMIGGSVEGSGTIEVGGGVGGGSATVVNTRVVGSIATRALLWDTVQDPDGRLDGCAFTMGTSGHGIEFGANTPSTITLRDVSFGSYGADGTTDAAIYNNSGKAVTINIVGGTSPTVRNGIGASTTLVINPVATTITAKDIDDGSAISGARVLVTASDNTGPMPFEKATSITRSGSTATATVTAHGLVNQKKAMIKGAEQQEYNGVYVVTVVDADTFTYTISGAPATPATGTIKTTGVVIDGTTDGSGVISDTRTHASDQPITGRVRKATTGTLYKTGSISGTISSSTGFSVTVQMIKDQ